MRRLIVAASFLAAGQAVFAQPVDVGLVNMVAGGARYAPLAGGAAEVKPFMKIRDGDRFNLPEGSRVRLVYYESARQEGWVGPASFRAGKAASEPIAGVPSEVTTLPAAAKQRIARIPELMRNAKLGGIQIRGTVAHQPPGSVDPQAALREARDTYEKMRGSASADDITPELVLYAALYDLQRYDDMKIAVDAMLRKQPENDELRQLRAWVDGRAGR